jgi:integrase
MAKGLDGRKLPPGITQRANGLYMGRVMYHGETHTLYDRNLSSLKKKMTDLRYELEHGTFIKKSDLTLEDWFKEWIATYKQNTVKQGTIKSYQAHFSAYIKPQIGKMKLEDIRPEHLQKLLNGMVEKDFADDTITLTYCVLSGIFKQAYKNELIPKNPLSVCTRPKGKAKKESFLYNLNCKGS